MIEEAIGYKINYLAVLLLGLAAVVVPILPLVLAKFIAPKKPSQGKSEPYECGVPSAGDPWGQFRIQYYLYAIAFVVFDVEVLFLFPWAIVFKQVGIAGFVAMVVFVAVLAIGLVYAWRKGALEWD
ncbi:MAG: NADH-quinone oxidoreductase subunit A [Candidatus Omnitrophica bacterium]|nr:NADH-quinone oxidoreductase subunit A [Candidatus Omnitrophota bacterium]